MPLSLTNAAIFAGLNLPAAHAVRTDKPSTSSIASQQGTLLFSISPRTIKYVSEKFVVTITGDLSVASPTLYIFCSTCIGTCGSVYIFCLKVRSDSIFHFSMLLNTMIDAYFITPMPATSASIMESSLFAKVITG